MSKGPWWTEEQTAALLSAVENGATPAGAAHVTGRSAESCIKKIDNLGIKPPSLAWRRTKKPKGSNRSRGNTAQQAQYSFDPGRLSLRKFSFEVDA